MNELGFATEETISTSDLLMGCEHNSRFEWALHELGPNSIFFFQDGLLLRLMAREAILCFIGGQFIATVLLAFSLIERSIAGRLLATGETGVREERSFEILLKRAHCKGWIGKHEFLHIKGICSDYRNSLAHIRTPTEPARHETRALAIDRELYGVVEEDARVVLRSAFNILRKTSV